MDIPIGHHHLHLGEPLTTLDKVTLAAMVALGPLTIAGMWFRDGVVTTQTLLFAATALLLAAVVATGRHWTPLLGAVMGGLLIAATGPFIVYSLRQPGETLSFAFWVIFLAVALVAIITGIAATVQNYRYPGVRRAPHWLIDTLAALGTLCLGAILVAAIPQGEAGISVSAETVASLPALGAENFKFDQAEIRAKAGETVALRLDNADGGPHSFDIDELNVHVGMPGQKSSLALFKAAQPGTYTFYCAVGQHREAGMAGQFIVEP